MTLKIRDIGSANWVFKARRDYFLKKELKKIVTKDLLQLPEKSTITGTCYIVTVLPKVVQETENQRSTGSTKDGPG